MNSIGNQSLSRMGGLLCIAVVSMGLLCGCSVKETNELLFAMPDGRPLTSSDAILIVFDSGNTLPPSVCDILRWTIFRWFGIESFCNPARLRLCHNESEQLKKTGQIQIPKTLCAVGVYLFVLENEEPFIYHSTLWRSSAWRSTNTTTVALLSFNSVDKRVLAMKESWANLFGHIRIAESNLLSDKQIEKLRRYITPIASEEYFEKCFFISPETLRKKASACGVRVQK